MYRIVYMTLHSYPEINFGGGLPIRVFPPPAGRRPGPMGPGKISQARSPRQGVPGKVS